MGGNRMKKITEKPKKRMLTADVIVSEGGIYPRNTHSWQTAYAYSQSMKAGAKFPAIEVAKIKNKYYLIDGKHRLEAIKVLNKEGNGKLDMDKRTKDSDIHVSCQVYSTLSLKEVYVMSVEKNVTHGLPFTTFDKLNIVKKLEGMNMGSKQISDIVRMPIDNIERLKITKMTQTVSGKPIVLKSSLRALAGKSVPDDFEDFQNQMDGGKDQVSLMDEVISLLEEGLIELTNNSVLERFNKLKKLINQVK